MAKSPELGESAKHLTRVLALVEAVGAVVNEAEPTPEKAASQLDKMQDAYRDLEKHGDI